MLGLWRKLPVLVRAVIAGWLVASFGTLPWAWIVAFNIKHGSDVPWSVPVMAVYLWLFWRYARGDGWPRSTSAARREALRNNNVSGEAFSAALLVGFLGFGVIVLGGGILDHLFTVKPQQVPPVVANLSFFTLFFATAMGAIVAGVVEEAAFRGYMQGPIERRHGPMVAILVTGFSFGLAHFSHKEMTWGFLPYYMIVAAIYGGIAWLTNSIYPGMALHAFGDLWTGIGGVIQLKSRQGEALGPLDPVVGGSGTPFGLTIAMFVLALAVTLGAFMALASVVRQERNAGAASSAPPHSL